jgi:sugar lactone lactonase YvrE
VFSSAAPGAKVVTFDHDGNLWVSLVGAGKVVKFAASQLIAGGSADPVVEESGINGPQGVAFDAAGNMWVASSGDDKVLRIDAAHLTTTGSGADLAISAQTGGLVNTPLGYPLGLAFDADGNLWVNYDHTIAELPASVLGGTGTLTVTPPVQLVTDPAALPEGIAFDEGGGIWFAYTAGRFARFARTQLIGQGSATPATIITSSDIGGGTAGWFAFYPAPAFTPLAHALN